MRFEDVYTSDRAPDFLWRLAAERSLEPEYNISFKLPSWEEHLEFIQSRPYAHWFLVVGDRYHGDIRLTWNNEVGINLLKLSRGMGIGRRALTKFFKEYKPLEAIPSKRPGVFVANINPKNERSIKLFTSLGFVLRQHTYERP